MSQLVSTQLVADGMQAVLGFKPSLKNLGSLDELQKLVGGKGPQQNAFA